MASSMIISLEEANRYPEIGMISAYAINSVYIGYSSMKIKMTPSVNKAYAFKTMDYDTQANFALGDTPGYEDAMKKVSQSFEQTIAIYRYLKAAPIYVSKTKSNAETLLQKINSAKKLIGNTTVIKIQNFKSGVLDVIKNAKFFQYLELKGEDSFVSHITSSDSRHAQIGTKDSPAIDCLQLRKLNRSIMSGFYYIKPECSPKPLRVFCDFALFGDAVDLLIFNDNSDSPNSDISYLSIADETDVRYYCAKNGLYPIRLENKDMVKRIYQVLRATGYNLDLPMAVPLGFDYSCKQDRTCVNLFKSFSDSNSTPIMTFFDGKSKAGLTKSGSFAGLGFSSSFNMLSFDPKSTPISALICSTNHFKTDASDYQFQTISCETSVVSNTNMFQIGTEVTVICPSSCQDIKIPIYGTGIYHAKSPICIAAIHSGAIHTTGGKLVVKVQSWTDGYTGTDDNSIKSKDWNKKDGASGFTLLEYEPKCPINMMPERKDNLDTSFVETSVDISSENTHQFDMEEFEGVDEGTLKKANINIESLQKMREDSEIEQLSTESIQDEVRFRGVDSKKLKANSQMLMQNTMNKINTIKNQSPLLQPTPQTLKNLIAPHNVAVKAKQALNVVKPQVSNMINKLPPLSILSRLNMNINNQPSAQAPMPIKEPDVCPPKKRNNGMPLVTTDDGIKQINDIRRVLDWELLKKFKSKQDKINKEILAFNQDLAWNNNKSETSTKRIQGKF